MKRLLISLIFVLFLVPALCLSGEMKGVSLHGVSIGGGSAAVADDVVTYETKQGTVTFNHKAHSEKQDCASCHEGEPAKIEINKKAAHGAACKDCHKKMSGPSKCKECHIKEAKAE